MSPRLLSSRLLPENRARSPILRPLPTRFRCDHGTPLGIFPQGRGHLRPDAHPGGRMLMVVRTHVNGYDLQKDDSFY
jgi:hypothetical protein